MTYQPQDVDLTTCDQEPIHIPGFTQPHGILLTLSEPDLHITQISNNIKAFIDRAVDQIIGQPLTILLAPEYIEHLHNVVIHEQIDANPLYLWTVPLEGSSKVYDGVLHRYDGVLILELEVAESKPVRIPDMYRQVKTTIGRLQQTRSFQDFCQQAADEIQALIGFDRVMVYQFDNDGSGTVVAENVRPDLQPYLGLHYPASDIPKQARELYIRNWLRLIADINAIPAQLVPTVNPVTDRPLDMSYAVLRSVSPIHIEYLRNMGVGASLSISLVKDGELWGLIACHHMSARYVPYEIRTACEFLAQAMSLQLIDKLHLDDQEYVSHMQTTLDVLSRQMLQADAWWHGLIDSETTALDYIESEGVVVVADNVYHCLGQTPPELMVRRLVTLLSEGPEQKLFATHALAKLYPEWAKYGDVAAGVLALTVSAQLQEYVLWFRPEVSQVVYWGGEPTKPVEVTEDGLRLSPRRSFEKWKQEVRLESLAWKDVEQRAAYDLRRAILEAVLYRTEELARENLDLERMNVELDSFAYIASHDLKEPLRGLHNYAYFLIEDYSDQLDEAGKYKLETLMHLTRRMESLIDSLLHYSRVGRTEFRVEPVDLNAVIDDLQHLMLPRLREEHVQLIVPRALPVVEGDEVQLSEVFSNLFSNAIKYNNSEQKNITVIWWDHDEAGAPALPEGVQLTNNGKIIAIQDNGIGILPQHADQIFRIFKRLHGRDQYGGGTGAGLTIVKKIIERHGGSIWLDANETGGTTFFFTL